MKIWTGVLTIFVAALLISVGNVYLNDMRFDENSAGVLVSALGVMVTFLVAWQIYNAVTIRHALAQNQNKIERLEKSCKMKLEQLNTMIHETRFLINYMLEQRTAAHAEKEWEDHVLAYLGYADAIILMLKSNIKRYNIQKESHELFDCFMNLEFCIDSINKQNEISIKIFNNYEHSYDERYLDILSLLNDDRYQMDDYYLSSLNNLRDRRRELLKKYGKISNSELKNYNKTSGPTENTND